MFSIFLCVQAKPPPASSTGRLGIRQSTLFNVLCVTALGLLPTLFYTAYVCSPIYSALRQLRICRPILEVGGSPGDLQYPGYYQRVDRNTIHFTYPSLSKGLLVVGSMVRFPIHNGYFGKPAHHTGVSTLSWLLISKLLNPQPADPGQDALGLITIYPRPDEHGISAATLGQRRPQPLYPTSFPSPEPQIAIEPIRNINNYISPFSYYHRRSRLSIYSEK